MNKFNIEIPAYFLKQENREGYIVTEEMKKVWAVELDLLSEAMRVMNKYGIKYYAIGGTLLGAVRHNGYIPWDDDIDIAIPRIDYEKFRKIAKKEFSHPYFFQDEFNDPGLLCGHAKLRNSDTTMVFSDFLNNSEKAGKLSINLGIFIDFFPVDNIPDDQTQRRVWISKIKKVATNAWNLRLFTHRGKTLDNNSWKYKFKALLLNTIFKCPNYYFTKYNKILSIYS